MMLAPTGFRGSFHTTEPERSRVSGASGIMQLLPAAVATPSDAADVATLVRWAAEHDVALVPRAAGTGMPGGNIGPGVVVDLLAGLRRISPVYAEAKRVSVEPGATLGELNRACAPAGLHFPVDPSSGNRCTLGGMIANNSAGAHSVRYGATRAWTQGLDVVLADGTPVRVERGVTREHPRLREIMAEVDAVLAPAREGILGGWPRVRKNSSGYALREYLETGDVVDLLVGSEGTLAVFVGAELRLAPIPPAPGLALLEFTRLEAAAAAVEALLPLGPATCELLDRTFLELVRDAQVDTGHPLRPDLQAILLVEIERERLHEVEDCARAFADRVVIASDPVQVERLWGIRHAASPLIAARTDGRVSMQFIEDGVVPVHRLPDYITALRTTLAREGIPAVIFGHAGDGNLHVNPLVDVQAPGWRESIERVLFTIADVVAELGGTMAGEHGDGRLRAPLLETIWSPEIVECFRRVKDAFDPAGILNPGVILPLPGQRPLDALRQFPIQLP